MTDTFEFTDRYTALGIPLPPVDTVCHGPCEGVGCYPAFSAEHGIRRGKVWWTCSVNALSAPEVVAWEREHAKAHSYRHMIGELLRYRAWWFWKSVLRDMLRGLPCDGWHFIRCADCGGTGRREIEEAAE